MSVTRDPRRVRRADARDGDRSVRYHGARPQPAYYRDVSRICAEYGVPFVAAETG
jgi:hypothetical protein